MEGEGKEKRKEKGNKEISVKDEMRKEIEKIKEEMEMTEVLRKKEKESLERMERHYEAEKEKAGKLEEQLEKEKEKREILEKKVEDIERLLQMERGQQEEEEEEGEEIGNEKEKVEDNSSTENTIVAKTKAEEVRRVQVIKLRDMKREEMQEDMKERSLLVIRDEENWKGQRFEDWLEEYTDAREWAEAGLKDEDDKWWIIFMTKKEKEEVYRRYESKWDSIISEKDKQPFHLELAMSRKQREELEIAEKTEKRIRIIEEKGEKYCREGWRIGYEGRWWCWDVERKMFTSEKM